MKSSASESKPFQSGSKGEIPGHETWGRIVIEEQRIFVVAWKKIVGLQIFLKASLKFGNTFKSEI